MKHLIVGLTGPYASGKSEVIEILKSKGFKDYSLSGVLREKLADEGVEQSRDNLINKGNELREKFGPGILAKILVEKFKDENIVIDSIRNPAEVAEFKKLKNFILVGIDAPIEIRFKRILKRDRLGDPKTVEELMTKEKFENSTNNNGQQLGKTFKMADTVIMNDGSYEDLIKKIEDVISNYNLN